MLIALVYRVMDGMVMDVNEGHVRQLREAFPDDDVVFARSLQDLKARGIRAECIVGGHPSLEKLDNEINFEQYCEWAGTVKWFHTMFTGTDAFVNDCSFSRFGIRFTNSGGVSAFPISEQIIAFCLCFARCLPQAFAQKQKHLWKRPENADELNGKTIGIVGMGNIGKAAAKKAKAFDMTVLGYKRTYADIDHVDRLYFGDDGLCKLLSVSDYVVTLLPKTESTYHIMNAERFACMKDGAFFINQGRGTCVDNDALIAALNNGKLGGAALDALDPEPLPDSSPLWDMENVIITSHYGGDAKRTFERSIDLFIENMPRYKAGRPLKNEIDLAAY